MFPISLFLSIHPCSAQFTEWTLYKTGMNHNEYLNYFFKKKKMTLSHVLYDIIKIKLKILMIFSGVK